MKSQNPLFKAHQKALYFVVVVAFLFITQPAQAQPNFQGGLSFIVGFPQGEFKDNVDENGYGIAGEFLYSPSTSPLGIGISMGYMNYGQESRREQFSVYIPEVEVEVSTTNNIAMGHLLLRAQNKTGPIRPYVEGLVGFNYLFTETKIEDVDDEEEIASSTNLDDGVFSYGGGGGVMLQLYSSKGKKAKIWRLLFDLRVRYIVGGEAEYLKEGSIRRENGHISYDVIKSKTNLLTTQIGIAVEF